MNHGWGKKRLGDVCDVIGGSTPKTEVKEFWNGNLNWFTPAEIADAKYYSSSDRKITTEAVKASGLTLMPPGTVLLTSRAPIGKVGITTEYSYCNQGFKNLICRENLYNEYLYHTLIYFNEEIKAKGRGVTFKEISKKATESISIPVPPLEVQKRIASELDKINELIEVKRSQLADLDVLAQSLFYEMFGDPIENPKEWKISKVSEILETGSGGTPSKSVDEFWSSEDIPWIGSNMCQNKILYETDGKFISKLGLENSSAKLLEPDTIIIALVGATIGKVALLKIPTSTNQNIGFIKPNKKIINPIFLFYTIQGLYSLFLEIGNGKFKMANLSFIRNLPIIIPPISLQNEFAMRIEAIEEQKKSIESSITDLQTLLASRMDYWFND